MKRFLVLITDVAAIYGALAGTILLRYPQEFSAQYHLHLVPFSLIALVWLTVFYITNLYDPQSWRNGVTFYGNLSRALTTATLLSVVFFYFIPFFGITPRTNLFIFIAVFAILNLAVRSLFNRIVSTRFSRRTLVIGINPQTLELASYLKDNPQIGYQVVAFFDLGATLFDTERSLDSSVRVIHQIDDLGHLIHDEHIETIVVSPEGYHVPRLINSLYRSLEHRISVYDLATLYERATGKVPLAAINQVWFLENFSHENKGWYTIAKRVVDITCAIALSTLALPLLPFIVLAIKLDSRGPILYRQLRMGKGGKSFMLAKFRNMIHDAERDTGPVWAAEHDSRTTRVGKYLRRWRIDELPQLWNVLKGEMSFVGPRPERPEFHDKLTDQIPFYEERYLVAPGLTGWAQIKHKLDFSGGMTVGDTAEKLQYDLFYVKNRSLLLDIGILLRTSNILIQRIFT